MIENLSPPSLILLETLRTWLSAINVLVSSFLTLLLVLLYRQQKNILKADHKPAIESTLSAEGEDAVVTISNYGRGPATNLRLQTVVEYPDSDVKGGELSLPLNRVKEYEKTRESSISGNSLDTEFRTIVPLQVNGSLQGNIFTGIYKAVENGANIIKVDFFITYEDQLDNYHRDQLTIHGRKLALTEAQREDVRSGREKINFESFWNLSVYC